MQQATEQSSKRVMVPMPDSLIAEINDFRFEARRESQADAVRELIKIGLESWRKQRAKNTGKADKP